MSTNLDSPNQSASNPKSLTGVALLDLDPGQPEYSAPGQLSLVHLLEPNFGPPFAHPKPASTSRTVRAHAIGAVSPSQDPSLYMACAIDLFGHYCSLLPNCPLLVNTPGWVLGTGLEILVELITKIHPTEVVYMSQDGPLEVTKILKDVAKEIPFLELPSQVSEYTTRTAAHLRTMQFMSYFHLNTSVGDSLTWSSLPLTSMPPWEVRYSGEDAGILGIMCYSEPPPAEFLAEMINGSLVAVVVIDDMSAIPGWEKEGQVKVDEDDIVDCTENTGYSKLRAFDDEPEHPRNLAAPLIVQTVQEYLPYFNPENLISLDPKYSHTIGLALVRGIDVERRRIQVITPLTQDVMDEIKEAGKSIVLVSGKLDTPGWAYIEELINMSTYDKAVSREGSSQIALATRNEEGRDYGGGQGEEDFNGMRRSLGEGFQNAPWIERLHGSQGRGVGARVWRVRRDLGRTGDGD